MNVLALTGRIVDGPVRRDTPDGVVCEFRLAVDGRFSLELTIRTAGDLAARCARELVAGRPVAVTAVVRHDDWAVHDGRAVGGRYVHASEVTLIDAVDEPDCSRRRDETGPGRDGVGVEVRSVTS